jgi:tetratricopeptide (TPR) repeat protein
MTIRPALMLLGLSLVASLPTYFAGRGSAAIPTSPIADRFGHVAFLNSGAPAAQRDFLDGLALLHDFEYDAARSAFQRAEAIDPSFVMAYWGEAMTFNAPVWQLRYADKARLALAKLAPTPEARSKMAKTPREAAYLSAVETLFATGEKHERDLAYADAMLALHTRFPDDVDATALAALALLGTADQGRDVAIYMRAAAMLEEVFPANRSHPGILHYLIHCYDDPAHAPLGLRAARLYGRVAPGAGHALHMTSHIFVALGDWDDTVTSNEQAMRVVNAKRVAAGKPESHCGHYDDWLHYAELQRGDFAAADKVMAQCRVTAVAELGRAKPGLVQSGGSSATSYFEMIARRAVETGRWDGDETALLPADAMLAPTFRLLYAEAITHRADRARLVAIAPHLHDIIARIAVEFAKLSPADAQEADADQKRLGIMASQVDAILLAAAGRRDDAIAALREVATREGSLPVDFGPPEILMPSQELLGSMLLEAGRPADAMAAYVIALQQGPKRRRALAGIQKARTTLPTKS